jgi:hypothetical protein
LFLGSRTAVLCTGGWIPDAVREQVSELKTTYLKHAWALDTNNTMFFLYILFGFDCTIL